MSVLTSLLQKQKSGAKSLAVLVDPDDDLQRIQEVAETALVAGVDLFLVGGSLVSKGHANEAVRLLKSLGVPKVVLFPGQEIQIVQEADAVLFLSLISGRNPEFLIGKQVTAAPWIKKAGLEAIPTGYMLVESGKLTSAVYMSHSVPLPSDKPDIAAATAMAGELLGMKAFYLDAGSGSVNTVPSGLISRVRNSVEGLIFVGGGIRNTESASSAWKSGADVVVIGNGAFEDESIVRAIAASCDRMNRDIIVS